MNRHIARAVVACSMVIGAGALSTAQSETPAAPKADLAFRSKVGETVHYTLTSKQSIKTEENNVPVDKAQTAGATLGIALTAKTSGASGATVELSLQRYGFDNEQAGPKTEFDSAKQPTTQTEHDIFKHVRPLLGCKITVKVDPRGTVQSITGVDRLPLTPITSKIVNEFLTKEAIQRKLSPIFTTRTMPGGTTAVGANWFSTDSITVAPGATATAKNQHKLTDISGTTAVITIKSTVDMPTPPERDDVVVTFSDAGSSGTQEWNTETGRLESFSGVQSVSVSAETEKKKTVRVYETRTSIRAGK